MQHRHRFRWGRLVAGVVAVLGLGLTALPALLPPPAAPQRDVPVLLVHGIFGSSLDMRDLEVYLRKRGLTHVEAVSLTPNDGSASLRELAKQLSPPFEALLARTKQQRADVVGYSMGALVSRYWLQRLGGKARVQRYVSLAGPHHGVPGGYLSDKPGAVEMRFGSDILRELDSDEDPWGSVDVYDFYTPLDLIIFPASTARLRGARVTRRIMVQDHHLMAHDPRAHQAVASALLEDLPAGEE